MARSGAGAEHPETGDVLMVDAWTPQGRRQIVTPDERMVLGHQDRLADVDRMNAQLLAQARSQSAATDARRDLGAADVGGLRALQGDRLTAQERLVGTYGERTRGARDLAQLEQELASQLLAQRLTGAQDLQSGRYRGELDLARERNVPSVMQQTRLGREQDLRERAALPRLEAQETIMPRVTDRLGTALMQPGGLDPESQAMLDLVTSGSRVAPVLQAERAQERDAAAAMREQEVADQARRAEAERAVLEQLLPAAYGTGQAAYINPAANLAMRLLGERLEDPELAAETQTAFEGARRATQMGAAADAVVSSARLGNAQGVQEAATRVTDTAASLAQAGRADDAVRVLDEVLRDLEAAIGTGEMAPDMRIEFGELMRGDYEEREDRRKAAGLIPVSRIAPVLRVVESMQRFRDELQEGR